MIDRIHEALKSFKHPITVHTTTHRSNNRIEIRYGRPKLYLYLSMNSNREEFDHAAIGFVDAEFLWRRYERILNLYHATVEAAIAAFDRRISNPFEELSMYFRDEDKKYLCHRLRYEKERFLEITWLLLSRVRIENEHEWLRNSIIGIGKKHGISDISDQYDQMLRNIEIAKSMQ